MAARSINAAPSSSAPDGPEPSSRPYRYSRLLDASAIGALAALVFFFHLGRYGLWEADEARYAEIAREMVAGAGYLVPHLNFVPYIEKPPLLYWLTSLCIALLGPTQLAARIVPAAAALAGVALTFWFANRAFDRRRALLAAAILITCPLYAAMAQVLTTDMLLTALMTAAFFGFFVLWQRGGRGWPLFYLAVALAVLTKGPVGFVLPAIAGGLFLWLVERSPLTALRKLHPVAGFLLVVVIAAPWFVLIALRMPGFVDFYVVGEHFRRVFVASYSHGEPFYFYLPVLVVGLIPWTVCAPLLIGYGTAGAARSYCIIVALVILGLFSLASAKLIPYILPALPAIAVLLADSILSALEDGRSRIGRAVVTATSAGLIAGALGLLVFIAVMPRAANPYFALLRPTLIAIAALLVVGGSLATAALVRRRSTAGLCLIVLTIGATLIAATYGRIAVEPIRPYSALCKEIAAAAPDATLICYHRYVQALPFYTHRRVILVGRSLSELKFGADHSLDRAKYFLPDDNQLIALWNRARAPLLVIDAGDLAKISARLGPTRTLASEGTKRAVIKAAH